MYIFDASASAIVVVVKQVQCSKITTEAQSECLDVFDILLKSRRLFSSALLIWGVCDKLISMVIVRWSAHDADDPNALLFSAPTKRLGWYHDSHGVTGHADFIQGNNVADALWKTIRRHKTLVTALQGHL